MKIVERDDDTLGLQLCKKSDSQNSFLSLALVVFRPPPMNIQEETSFPDYLLSLSPWRTADKLFYSSVVHFFHPAASTRSSESMTTLHMSHLRFFLLSTDSRLAIPQVHFSRDFPKSPTTTGILNQCPEKHHRIRIWQTDINPPLLLIISHVYFIEGDKENTEMIPPTFIIICRHSISK